ncbi:MAG: hypothetical protein KAG66_17525, partial [Methylococcales bacterium]|nr:hypothetical protein [Methylococcales bacterium]
FTTIFWAVDASAFVLSIDPEQNTFKEDDGIVSIGVKLVPEEEDLFSFEQQTFSNPCRVSGQIASTNDIKSKGTFELFVDQASYPASTQIEVEVVQDDIDEPDESIALEFEAVKESCGKKTVTRQGGQVTILDDDGDPPTSGNIVFDPTSYTVDEDKGTVTLSLKRENGNEGVLTATVRTLNRKAIAGEDYIGKIAEEVEFQAGDVSKTVSIEIIRNEDGTEVAEEEFVVSLTDTNKGNSSAIVSITDVPKAKGALQFSASNYPVNEPAKGSDGSVAITVNRVGGASGVLSATFDVNSGTAKEGSGLDYTNPPENGTTLTWAENDDTPKIISIPILSDDTVEPDSETFTVMLSGDAPTETATVTITDSTPP